MKLKYQNSVFQDYTECINSVEDLFIYKSFSSFKACKPLGYVTKRHSFRRYLLPVCIDVCIMSVCGTLFCASHAYPCFHFLVPNTGVCFSISMICHCASLIEHRLLYFITFFSLLIILRCVIIQDYLQFLVEIYTRILLHHAYISASQHSLVQVGDHLESENLHFGRQNQKELSVAFNTPVVSL